MALFGSSTKKDVQFAAVQDPGWVKLAGGRFHRFILLDAEKAGLAGIGGIYAIWHGGLRPEWVSIGKSDDLAAAFRDLAGNEDIRNYNVRGGLFVSWALIREEFRNGVLRFLNDSMKPLVPGPDTPGENVTPIPVIGPLTEYKAIVGETDKDQAAPTPRA
jgi:hypothetical protein